MNQNTLFVFPAIRNFGSGQKKLNTESNQGYRSQCVVFIVKNQNRSEKREKKRSGVPSVRLCGKSEKLNTEHGKTTDIILPLLSCKYHILHINLPKREKGISPASGGIRLQRRLVKNNN